MIIQAVIPLSILTTMLLLQPAGRASSSTAAKAKCHWLYRLYIRESLFIHINNLDGKYSYLIGDFGLKLPILMGSFKGEAPSIWARI
jgi:hypothetical protein